MVHISSVFCSALGQPPKLSSKKLLTIPVYTHFFKFMKIFNHQKSIIGIYTYALTLNKNPAFNYKRYHNNKYTCINNK